MDGVGFLLLGSAIVQAVFLEPNDAIPQLLETVNRGEVGNEQKQCCLSLNDANSTPKPRSGFA